MSSGLAAKLSDLNSWRLSRPLPRLRLTRFLPRSLFGRSLLIVVMPLVILQVVLTYIFYERHWDSVTRWLAVGLAGEVSLLVELLENAEDGEARTKALQLARDHFGFAVSFEPGGTLAPDTERDGLLSELIAEIGIDKTLRKYFRKILDRPFTIDTRPVDLPKRIAVYVQLDDGLLRVLAPRKRVDSKTTQVFIGWMFGLSLILLMVAIFLLKRQVRPIRRLAWAADNFGKGRDVGDFKLAGPTEIRQAGAAFNLMRKRILRHLSQRTEMLAAVSHDLRTPLTRMKLELELLSQSGGTDFEGLRADVEEMAKVVDEYLAFVRGEGQEAIEVTDLGGLLEDVAARSTRNGKTIEVALETPISLPLRPVAIRRCIANLVENALRCADNVQIRATTSRHQVWIAIDDDGPGIPAEARELVFRPFYRLDASRSPGAGGVGLGLTIARDIVLAHGGHIELDDAPLGGLRVLIRLPR